MRFLGTLVVLVLVAAAAVGIGAWWEERNFNAPGQAPQQTIVNVPPGSGLSKIAMDLANAGVIRDARLFQFGVWRRGAMANLKAGEYGFPARASMARVLQMLVRGDVIQHPLTIPEGWTTDMAMAAVRSNPFLTGGMPATPPEGSLLPETYLFQRGTTREAIVARMREAQKKLLDELWPKRKAGLPYDTIEEALTLASIVEKETAIAAERPRIAAVFVNRLRRPMRLESDPTIIYGLTKGMPLGHPLRQSELARPNPSIW
jgi:UPF0755 protein